MGLNRVVRYGLFLPSRLQRNLFSRLVTVNPEIKVSVLNFFQLPLFEGFSPVCWPLLIKTLSRLFFSFLFFFSTTKSACAYTFRTWEERRWTSQSSPDTAWHFLESVACSLLFFAQPCGQGQAGRALTTGCFRGDVENLGAS